MPDINEFHEAELKKLGIPKWANVDCPFCKEELPLRSIREFGVKLNSRNMTDLFVTVHCDKCQKMDTMYFRKEITEMADFVDLLQENVSPTSIPIIEEDMYNTKYNNLIEIGYGLATKVAPDQSGNKEQ